jgi:hypothetical protein
MAPTMAETREYGLTEVPQAESPSHEEIAKLAYALWEARDGTGASPEEDWYIAEAELRRR